MYMKCPEKAELWRQISCCQGLGEEGWGVTGKEGMNLFLFGVMKMF